MTTLKGGKTAPRFLADLRLYNPDKLPFSGYNVLSQSAFPFEHDNGPRRTTGKGSCKHRWVPKLHQNSFDSEKDDAIPKVKRASAFCANCYNHVRLEIDTSRCIPDGGLCPNKEYPLHHFEYLPDSSTGFLRSGPTEEKWADGRTFECTSTSCQAVLRCTFYCPQLTKEFVALLTDANIIKARAQSAMNADPTRFEGHAIPSSLTVMNNLKSYLANSLVQEPRRIKEGNKKWTLCFGDSCKPLLDFLEFKKEDEGWMPPRPDLSDTVPFMSPFKILIDDTICELEALMSIQPEDEKRISKIFVELKSDADWAKKLLGCADYSRSLASRTSGLTADLEHPYYAGLGAVADFHDSLIQFAYERQIACDSANNSYYLECLNGIADGRKSEDLKTKAAIEASTGKLSDTEIKAAYAAFNLDFQYSRLDDDHIIGLFQSRASDAPLQEAELRRNLKIIGKHRNSQKIEEFASGMVTTYQQALDWLGASAEMDDSFIVVMCGVKLQENPAQEEVARNCVKLIADHRKSSALKQWLDTGELGDIEMNIEHAYQLLELPDRTATDDAIYAQFLVYVGDFPKKEQNYQKALRAIAEERNSDFLRAYVDDWDAGPHSQAGTSPVGLSNIGNTCYLNSLLQYLFSIKPVRDVILDFENHKEDITNDLILQKEVGGRRISMDEVIRSQLFIQELRQLFMMMIKAPSKVVTPRKKLAHLTILTTQSEADAKKRKEAAAQKEAATNGPKPKSQAEAMEGVSLLQENPPISSSKPLIGVDAMEEDVGSEGTLVDKVSEAVPSYDITKQAEAFENKENLAPRVEEIARSQSPEKHLQPLAPASPSRVNEQQPLQPMEIDASAKSTEDEKPVKLSEESAITTAPVAAPSRPPPPVPPRGNVAAKSDDLLFEAAEFEAKQRDVTEVLENVFFQLQCALKPDALDDAGELTDFTKQLFYSKTRQSYDNKRIDTTEAIFQDIKVQLQEGPRHIYEALDEVFDRHNIELGDAIESRYSTLLVLPPILQIFVSRGQFDKQQKKASKAMHHLELDKTIYMDRYLISEDSDLFAQRVNSWKWKGELRDLQTRLQELDTTDVGMSMVQTLEMTAAYLQTNGVKETENAAEQEKLAQEILEAAARTRHEVTDIKARISKLQTLIKSQFMELKNHPYNIFAVFIHRGGINAGHYWIYIRDFHQQAWRKYNDGHVTKVEESEVFSAGDPSRPSTSAFVVYIKAGMEENLTQAVCRDITNENGQELSPDQKLQQWSQNLQAPKEDVLMDG